MTQGHPATEPELTRSKKCTACDQYASKQATHCPNCGQPLIAQTRILPRHEATTRSAPGALIQDSTVHFPPQASLVLVLGPEMRLLLTLHEPVTLGRGPLDELDDTVDLAAFGAFRQGVSRHHCQFQRRNDRLAIRDLGSANGTFLNGHRLVAHRAYTLQHDDTLHLGALEMRVQFRLTHD